MLSDFILELLQVVLIILAINTCNHVALIQIDLLKATSCLTLSWLISSPNLFNQISNNFFYQIQFFRWLNSIFWEFNIFIEAIFLDSLKNLIVCDTNLHLNFVAVARLGGWYFLVVICDWRRLGHSWLLMEFVLLYVMEDVHSLFLFIL